MAQDAFVQAYVKLATFERASAFYTWLYRIAVNLAISRRRRAGPRSAWTTPARCSGTSRWIGVAPGDRLERAERGYQVRLAMARLSDEHRQVLVLREIGRL